MEPSETRNSPQGGHSSALELIRLTLPGLRRISNLKERGQLLSNPQGSPLFVAPRPGCAAGHASTCDHQESSIFFSLNPKHDEGIKPRNLNSIPKKQNQGIRSL
ncbi:hypothetical protein VUR80DRAFT_7913 [Thermomyces stellatus]